VLATFVIGLREGLEAALIVSIIAAFLKRNGASMKPMWWGVGAAVALSIGVGLALTAIEQSLPQAQQELMEAVIGAVAVVFVTGMIAWMKTHARGLKRELETEAQAALGNGTTWAMAGMAFLAVLKEGFETSVFLLATFQASTSETAAVIGAAAGILAAVGVGIGIYAGGVRLNLGRFFTATGVFLVFVAAGLVISTLRSAYEAGILTIGQGRTVDLSWLAPNGSVQAALVTGVLGIPADPRVIEVLAWFLYLVPVLAYSVWPAAWRPRAERVPRLQLAGGVALVLAALVLAIFVPAAGSAPALDASAPIAGGGTATISTQDGSARLRVTGAHAASYDFGANDSSSSSHAGADTVWRAKQTRRLTDRPSSVTLDRLVQLAGGRVPVGVDAARNPGPFDAKWTQTSSVTAWSLDDTLIDAHRETRTVLSISGGGLGASRAIAVGGDTDGWHVAPAHVAASTAAIADRAKAEREALLWKLWLPIVLAIAGAVLVAIGVRRLRAERAAVPAQRAEDPLTTPASASAHPTTSRSTSYAAKS